MIKKFKNFAKSNPDFIPTAMIVSYGLGSYFLGLVIGNKIGKEEMKMKMGITLNTLYAANPTLKSSMDETIKTVSENIS